LSTTIPKTLKITDNVVTHRFYARYARLPLSLIRNKQREKIRAKLKKQWRKTQGKLRKTLGKSWQKNTQEFFRKTQYPVN